MIERPPGPRNEPGRVLNVGLWLIQFLLFATFAWAAWMKIMVPISDLAAMWPWAGELPRPVVRGLGVVDLMGGVGVLVPMATRIKPWLTVLAAIGCVALQVCALIFHASRGEIAALPVNVLFLVMASFITWGRWGSRWRPTRHLQVG